MGNLKRRKCSVYLERIKNEQIFSKRHNDLYKSVDNISSGVFRTKWNIYDGVFCENK